MCNGCPNKYIPRGNKTNYAMYIFCCRVKARCKQMQRRRRGRRRWQMVLLVGGNCKMEKASGSTKNKRYWVVCCTATCTMYEYMRIMSIYEIYLCLYINELVNIKWMKWKSRKREGARDGERRKAYLLSICIAARDV